MQPTSTCLNLCLATAERPCYTGGKCSMRSASWMKTFLYDEDSGRVGNLSGHELKASQRRFVVENLQHNRLFSSPLLLRHHVDHLVDEAFLGCYLDSGVLSQLQRLQPRRHCFKVGVLGF